MQITDKLWKHLLRTSQRPEKGIILREAIIRFVTYLVAPFKVTLTFANAFTIVTDTRQKNILCSCLILQENLCC